jgi:hypothetical protein
LILLKIYQTIKKRRFKIEKLTETEAFEAMVLFLEGFYERTQSDDVGALLSQMIILEDGTTADPAAWDDWMKSVHRVLNKEYV